MTVSQTNMAVDYSFTLPFWLVTKDSTIIELLVYVNLTVSKVNYSWQGGGGGGLVGDGHLF